MKNKLMIYRGGGYSGCHWEWNYCFWNSAGEWFDVYSSGKDGLDFESAALEYSESIDYPDVIVDLTSQDEIDEMYTDFNEDMIRAIVQWLSMEHSYSLELKCSVCGGYIPIEDDFTCYGGVCPVCYDSGQCQECFEYCGDDLDEDGLCPDCVFEQEARIERERIDDLRAEFFEAQLIGEIDMFDDRFRELWG